MLHSLNSKFLLGSLVAGILASPLGAIALSVNRMGDIPSRVVDYTDLDLSRSSGIATLYTRINSAAREVCEPLDVWSVKLLHKTYECRQDAIGRAVGEVNSPSLTSYFEERSKASGADPGRNLRVPSPQFR
jgi:UrcA family protein